MEGFNVHNIVVVFPNSFGGGMDISDRSPRPETCSGGMPVPAHHRNKVSSHVTLRCRLRISGVFLAVSSVARLQIRRSESRTLVLPNRTNRSSPGSSLGSSHSPGALSDASAGIAHVVRGLLRSERDGLSGYFGGVLVPARRRPKLPSRS